MKLADSGMLAPRTGAAPSEPSAVWLASSPGCFFISACHRFFTALSVLQHVMAGRHHRHMRQRGELAAGGLGGSAAAQSW